MWSMGSSHYTAHCPQGVLTGIAVCTVSVPEVSNNTCWLSVVWAVSNKSCLLAWLLTVLKALTMLITNKMKCYSSWSQNLKLGPNWADKNNFWVMKLDRCSFQAPLCLTQTQTDGNTLCRLIYTYIAGTLSCQNLTGNMWGIMKLVKHFIQNAVTESKWYTLNVYQHLLENVVR